MTAGDRHVRVFDNVTGYKVRAESAKLRLKNAQTAATRERLEKMIEDCQSFLATIKSQ